MFLITQILLSKYENITQKNFRFGNKPEHYMVIDFGGGTLDICIIKTDILGRTPKIISTSGDPQLGGKEFDEIIEHLFFRNNESIKNEMLYRTENIFILNHKNLEDIKIFLSTPFLKTKLSQYTINNWITEFTQQAPELCSTI